MKTKNQFKKSPNLKVVKPTKTPSNEESEISTTAS